MTTRVSTILVVLDQPTREDDAEPLVNAIRMIRGVARVEVGPVDNVAESAAKARVQNDMRARLRDLLETLY